MPVIAWPVGRYTHFRSRDVHLAEASGMKLGLSAIEGYADLGQKGGHAVGLSHCDRFSWPEDRLELAVCSTGAEVLRRSLFRPAGNGSLRYRGLVAGSIDEERKEVTLRQRMGQIGRVVSRKLQLECPITPVTQSDTKVSDWSSVTRLVFICKGNVCRSPYAAAKAEELGIETVSCGLEVLKSVAAEPNAVIAALSRGLDITGHTSRNCDSVALRAGDCVLVMDRKQLARARSQARLPEVPVLLLGSFANPPIPSIPDPYGQALNRFQEVFDLIDGCLNGIQRARSAAMTNG